MRPSIYGILVGFLLAPLPAFAQPCTLEGLKWLKGVWMQKNDETHGEERWTISPSGQMVGASWFLHPGRDGGLIESMTILPDKDLSGNDRIVLRIRHFNATLTQAEEEKDGPMQFVASSCERNMVVFDGQGARAGEHMTYRRSFSRLSFVGEFLHDGKSVRDEETFSRAGD
jgi:hypothetical protein